MLHWLDESLEAFLRAEVALSDGDVEISFAAPDREWGAGVTNPTLNVFLWDVRPNLAEREAGMQLVEEEGQRVRRQPAPRVDCRYCITAWTAEVQDEHALLGAVLATALRCPEIAAEHLHPTYAAVRPLPTLTVGVRDGSDQADFWSALGGQLKPGLDVVVTATVDASLVSEAGPPTARYELNLRDMAGAATSQRRHTADGGGATNGPVDTHERRRS